MLLTTSRRKFGEEESYHAGEFGGAVQVGEQETGNLDALASAAAVKLKKILASTAAVKLKVICRLCSFSDFDVLASAATVKRKKKLWGSFFFGRFCSCICCCEAGENLSAPVFGDFGVLASAATVKLQKFVGFVLFWRF